MVQLLFDDTGLAEADALPPVDDDAADRTESLRTLWRTFLRPFHPKADEDYLVRIQGGVRRHGRHHETLVNNFSEWLQHRGLEVGCNAAIDIGIEDPPVVIEAKIVKVWSTSIREAIGQLYEYRYFRVANPQAKLIFLASRPVPSDWVRYLERDRKIGAAWPVGKKFELSPSARAALRLRNI